MQLLDRFGTITSATLVIIIRNISNINPSKYKLDDHPSLQTIPLGKLMGVFRLVSTVELLWLVLPHSDQCFCTNEETILETGRKSLHGNWSILRFHGTSLRSSTTWKCESKLGTLRFWIFRTGNHWNSWIFTALHF